MKGKSGKQEQRRSSEMEALLAEMIRLLAQLALRHEDAEKHLAPGPSLPHADEDTARRKAW